MKTGELLSHNPDIRWCILFFFQLTKAVFPKQSTPPHNALANTFFSSLYLSISSLPMCVVCMFVFPFICKRIQRIWIFGSFFDPIQEIHRLVLNTYQCSCLLKTVNRFYVAKVLGKWQISNLILI